VTRQHTGDATISRRAIVIANGFFPFPVSIEHIADIYRREGYATQVLPFSLADMCDIKVYAQSIAQTVEKAYRESGQRVYLLGMSMGGLASLYAIKFMDCAKYVHTLIAIGSPFGGIMYAYSALAIPIFSRSGLQMTPGSELLSNLRENEAPQNVRLISVGGIVDGLVYMPSTHLPEAENYLWWFTHHGMFTLSWMHERIIELFLD